MTVSKVMGAGHDLDVTEANDTKRTLSHGIYPAIVKIAAQTHFFQQVIRLMLCMSRYKNNTAATRPA